MLAGGWNASGRSIEKTMSKYRDYRDQRRHRRHDEESGFSERTPEPSYFHRPPPIVGQSVDAEVLWFNAAKGFGFVKLADGAEAYMNMRALEAAGSREVVEGTRLKVTIEETPKGRQVTHVLEIGDALLKSPSHGGRRGAIAAGTDPESKTEGTVKWYNAEKGFGFIAPSNGGRDIFVHATALTRSGLSGLTEGQKVVAECGQGKKGIEVQTIRVA